MKRSYIQVLRLVHTVRFKARSHVQFKARSHGAI